MVGASFLVQKLGFSVCFFKFGFFIIRQQLKPPSGIRAPCLFLCLISEIKDIFLRCAGCLPPCRCLAGLRSTRVDFSMGTMNCCILFRPHLTRRMGSADTARQLRVTTFDHSTSTTTNRPPDQHFNPISVVRVDGKLVRGWNSVTAGRPAHSPGEWR